VFASKPIGAETKQLGRSSVDVAGQTNRDTSSIVADARSGLDSLKVTSKTKRRAKVNDKAVSDRGTHIFVELPA
jgi:hypothetical protein